MSDHALFSPSSAHRWLVCAGSVALAKDLPDPSSKYADEGTLAHALAAQCLSTGTDARGFVGGVNLPENPELHDKVITPEMATDVQVYIDNIRERVGDGELRVEQKVDFSKWVGHPNQTGTADALILSADGTHLIVADLKFGRGVPVYAEENPQLMLYALGALERYELVADITHVVLEVHQPRLQHLDQWKVSIEDLHAFAQKAEAAVATSLDVLAIVEGGGTVGSNDLLDGEHCRFCKAKATCPKLSASVQLAVGDFENLDEKTALEKVSAFTLANLAQAMSSVDLIEQWCSAVRAEVERKLLAGDSVEGWKLVQGKRGNREWVDPVEAEAYFRKACRHDEIYKSVLLTPTQIEKRTKPWIDDEGNERKPILGPRQLKTFATMVTQSNGKASVAPETDKRPALVIPKFEALTGADDLC